jgi:hypothetical protein
MLPPKNKTAAQFGSLTSEEGASIGPRADLEPTATGYLSIRNAKYKNSLDSGDAIPQAGAFQHAMDPGRRVLDGL